MFTSGLILEREIHYELVVMLSKRIGAIIFGIGLDLWMGRVPLLPPQMVHGWVGFSPDGF